MKSEKGQSLVEFALVIPVLIFLLFGIIDFARLYHAYLTIDHAGREAARSASIGNNDVFVKGVAVDQATSIGLNTGQVTVSYSGNPSPGNNITITINYPVTFITPGISAIKESVTLTDITVMRVE